jgi:D-glycero-alpha-D-manno-heptose-7-phosphate kinase
MAPLRLGLAGGGTDVSPYSELYGGSILNATINQFAYATIAPAAESGCVNLYSADRQETETLNATSLLPLNGKLDLLKGIVNRIRQDFDTGPLSFELTTYVDAPPGSGLGSSSTLVTAVIGAFKEWLRLPLGEYDIARLAYRIERIDLNYAGGKQDQYSATFGGVNFMEFYADDKVIVNPLRIREETLKELAFNIVLYYTGTSRLSSDIIARQQKSIEQKSDAHVQAMHQTRQMAIMMKEALLQNDLNRLGELMHEGWQYKKKMAAGISNSKIDEIYDAALAAGASGGKISGAGGGGYLFFFCPGNSRYHVIERLKQFGGHIHPFQFTKSGLQSWTVTATAYR